MTNQFMLAVSFVGFVAQAVLALFTIRQSVKDVKARRAIRNAETRAAAAELKLALCEAELEEAHAAHDADIDESEVLRELDGRRIVALETQVAKAEAALAGAKGTAASFAASFPYTGYNPLPYTGYNPYLWPSTTASTFTGVAYTPHSLSSPHSLSLPHSLPSPPRTTTPSGGDYKWNAECGVWDPVAQWDPGQNPPTA